MKQIRQLVMILGASENPNVISRGHSNVKTTILHTNGCNFRIRHHPIESRGNIPMQNFMGNPIFSSKTVKS